MQCIGIGKDGLTPGGNIPGLRVLRDCARVLTGFIIAEGDSQLVRIRKMWSTFRQRLKAITDARYDSARNAIYATVSLLESSSGEMLSIFTEDRRKLGVTSQALEPILTKRALREVTDAGINIEVVAHDDNPTISKIINNWVNCDLSHTRSQLDSWHAFKNIAKKLGLLLDERTSLPPNVYITVRALTAPGLRHVATCLGIPSTGPSAELKLKIDKRIRELNLINGKRVQLNFSDGSESARLVSNAKKNSAVDQQRLAEGKSSNRRSASKKTKATTSKK